MKEISFESLEVTDHFVVENSEQYQLYRDEDLKRVALELIQNSRWHQEVATMSQTNAEAMTSVKKEKFTPQQLSELLIQSGFSKISEDWRKSVFERIAVRAEPKSQAFSIGQNGPGGGLIFWVNTGQDGLPDALELAPEDWFDATSNERDCPMKWCVDPDELEQVKMNSKSIGFARANRDAIDESDVFCAPQFQVENFLDDDWFLPTIDELELIYRNIHEQGLGDMRGSQYWSSSVFIPPYVYSLNFENGEVMMSSATMGLFVRPIREVWGSSKV